MQIKKMSEIVIAFILILSLFTLYAGQISEINTIAQAATEYHVSLPLILGNTSRFNTTASVPPQPVPGDTTCEGLGYDYGFIPLPEPPAPGTSTYLFPGGVISLTVDADLIYFDWESSLGMDAVVVKGGTDANLFAYDPPGESTGDSSLSAPVNPDTGGPHAVEHLELCYDYELQVSKDAIPSFLREYSWSIDKAMDTTDMVVYPDQTVDVGSHITVTNIYTDSDWAVAGEVIIYNPAPIDTVIVTITDVITPGIPIPLDCGVTLPYTLTTMTSLLCTYNLELADGIARTNTVTVTVPEDSQVGGSVASADFSFEEPTIEIDGCIDIYDDMGDPANPVLVGTVCGVADPVVIDYQTPIGPYAICDVYDFTNHAWFITDPSSTTGEVSWNMTVYVPCPDACTLTQGYWKNHSWYGPAPYDDTWTHLWDPAADPDGDYPIFYNTGKTWHQVLRTAPKGGNAYIIIAHQYIAAYLNIYNGVDPTVILETMQHAEQLLSVYTSEDVLPKDVRQDFLETKDMLEMFNEGYIGPGHCSD